MVTLVTVSVEDVANNDLSLFDKRTAVCNVGLPSGFFPSDAPTKIAFVSV
jgi:hypothetical protein